MKEPTAEALVQNLLRFAVNTEDIHTVQRLLKTGLNSNNHVCHKNSISVTPLQRACELHDVKIVAFLVKEGVDANRQFLCSPQLPQIEGGTSEFIGRGSAHIR